MILDVVLVRELTAVSALSVGEDASSLSDAVLVKYFFQKSMWSEAGSCTSPLVPPQVTVHPVLLMLCFLLVCDFLDYFEANLSKSLIWCGMKSARE